MPYSSTLMGLSTRDVMRILEITEPTLRNWILTKKIRPRIHKIGMRNYYDFAEEEVDRVKRLLNKDWEQGKPKLSREK